VFLIPLIIGYAGLFQGLRQLTEDVRTSNLRLLQLNQQLLNTELERLRELALRIDRTPELRRLYSTTGPIDGPQPVWLLEAQEEIYDHVIPDALLHEVIVYAADVNVVFTSNDIFVHPEIFTEDFFSYGDLDPEEVRSQLLTPVPSREFLGATPFEYAGRGARAVLLRQGLPLDNPSRREAALLIALDAGELTERLEAIIGDRPGYAAIVDARGRAIASVTPPGRSMPDVSRHLTGSRGSFALTIADGDYTGAYVRDERMELSHVVVAPTRGYVEQASRLQIVTVLAAAAAVGVGLLVSLFFGYRTGKPIAELTDVLKRANSGDESGKPVFNFLSQSVERLIANNSELQEAVDAQRPLAAMALVERLLRGDYVSQDEVTRSLPEVGIRAYGRFYAVMLVVGDYAGFERSGTTRKVLVRAALEEQSAPWPVIDRGSDELALVVRSDRDDPESAAEEFRRRAREVIDDLEMRFRAAVRVYVGTAQRDIVALSTSLSAAQVARAHSAVNSDRQVLGADDIPASDMHLSYPVTVESQLIAAIIAGDQERVDHLLDGVMAENYRKRALSEREVRRLYGELQGTALRALEFVLDPETRARLVDLLEQPLVGTEEGQFHGQSREMLQGTAAVFARRHGRHHQELKDKMERYVTDKLLDRNLSLAAMAEYAGVSEAYASAMFKEVMGERFGSYVERERLALAQRLLIEGRYTIDQIAARVGYNSATSFRRAFKRRFGVPPSGGRRNGHPVEG
jgi:AraC-like DNA-binding protein